MINIKYKVLIHYIFGHKWQTRGINRYGTTTYRVCLRCREPQERINKSYEDDKFKKCEPISDLDAQFDSSDKFIYKYGTY